MKAILEFNLPDEKNEFTLAVKGDSYYCVLWDLNSWFRDMIKHDDREDLEEVREMLNIFMEKHNCNFDDVE
jgi:hypothetical protein